MHDSDQEREQALLAAAALGSLDPADLAALDQLLTSSPAARAELQQLRETVALLPYAAPPVSPPQRVRAQLMARIAADQAQRARGASPNPTRRAGWLVPAALTALAVVMVFLGSLTLSLQSQVAALTATNQQLLAAVRDLRQAVTDSEAQQAQLAAQLARSEQQIARLNEQIEHERLLVSFVSAPGVATRELLPTRADLTARGEMYMYPGEAQAVVVFSGLPQLQPDRVYRFWLSDGVQRIAAGTFHVDATGLATLVVTAPREVNAYTEVMVTVEPTDAAAPGEVEVILTGTL
ncbi:anti-sigma factor domain-containing protein [Chloroflexus sp.]|uniref:anti-sigma factor domain-containing protein n=1 Tax=Chloroflexus sp. TaxID=1904827 RepID=UPI00262137C6|nr:anti-sigma factor [uncultured Chloroflexus sp.]